MKTVDYIAKMKRNFVRISSKQEKAILQYWGKNIGTEFTEQDICEQTKKVMENV